MKLYPDKMEEYTKRHNPIWPDLETTLKEHGVHNYSIFLDSDTDTLFGYVEVESEEKWNAIAQTTVCKKWWSYMADIMEANPDYSPVSKDLEPLFYMP